MLGKEVSSTIFSSFWYDTNWDWTPVSQIIGERSNHYSNESATVCARTRATVFFLWYISFCWLFNAQNIFVEEL